MKVDDICLYRFFEDLEGKTWKKYLDTLDVVYKDLKYDSNTHKMENLYKPLSTWVKDEPDITNLPLVSYVKVYDDPSDETTYLSKVAVIHRTFEALKEDDALI